MPVTVGRKNPMIVSRQQKKKRIFVIHASCGSGHRRAAEAVHTALETEGMPEIRTLDILEEAPAWYRKLYRDGYALLVQKAPGGWDRIYRWCDVPSGTGRRRLLESLEGKIVHRFLQRIVAEKPDAVVCTHYLPLYLLGALKIQRHYRGTLLGVITDYRLHKMWVNPGADGYAVASQATREDLIACGVPPVKIHVTGIPIHPIFGNGFDRREIRRKLEIPEDRPMILILSGGIGMGKLDKFLRELRPLAGQVTFVASSAGNPVLQQTLERIREREIPDLRIIGFVKNIQEYMGAADLLMTKPGGLTVSEALTLHLPMILIDPIPGQEEGNARYLVEKGAALWVNRKDTALTHVAPLLQSPEPLERMRDRMKLLAKPLAARRIARLLNYLSH